MASKTGNSQLCALLSYLFVGIVWYFVDEKLKKDDFVKFHVKQSIILIIFWIIWSIALGILRVGLFFLWQIWALLDYVPLVFAVIGIIAAINSKKKELPVIGTYASKLNF